MFMFVFHKKRKNEKSGFALLIAVVVSSVVLTIGISIINTALKEVVLASTVRNSLSGFYTADSAIECALYWDNIRGRFGTPSYFSIGAPTEIECGGMITSVIGGSHFSLINTSDLNAPCADVNVSSVSVGPDEERVIMRGLGSNTCDLNNSKRVERALEVRYSRFR